MLEQMERRLVAWVGEYPNREQDTKEQDVNRQKVARDEAARAEQEPYRGFVGALGHLRPLGYRPPPRSWRQPTGCNLAARLSFRGEDSRGSAGRTLSAPAST